MNSSALIAIVDDDEGIRASLDGLFRSVGYAVATYASAEAFLASTAARESACVVSDVRMPGGMDGINLAQAVIAAGMPVILISAFIDARLEREARVAGVLHVLSKPFDPELLVSVVGEALAKKR